MNEALVAWLDDGPRCPDERLTLDDWLRRALSGTSGPPVEGVGARTFFSVAPDNLERARAVCASCPMRDECYQYVMADPDLMGIWAGFTEKERRALRRAGVA